MTPSSRWPGNDWRNKYFSGENLQQTLQRVDALKTLLPKGMTLPALALRFILSNPDVSTTIPGMRKTRNVEANLAVSGLGPIPADLLAELRKHRWVRNVTPESFTSKVKRK